MSYLVFPLQLTGKPHKCLFCFFYTNSVSILYEIQAFAVTWSAIISYTTVDNFVRHVAGTVKRLSLKIIIVGSVVNIKIQI